MKKGLVLVLGLFFIATGSLLTREAKVSPVAFTLANSGGGVLGSGSPRMSFRLAGTPVALTAGAGPGGAGVIEDWILGNTAIGWEALFSNTTGENNTASGFKVLYKNETGSHNTACGNNVLYYNQTGYDNTAIGSFALWQNVDGFFNTASGTGALAMNVHGNRNTAVGVNALRNNDASSDDTAVGFSALSNTVNGGAEFNTALGSHAGDGLQQGDWNIFIGTEVWGEAYDSHTIRIGYPYDSYDKRFQNKTFIAGIIESPLDAGMNPAVVGITSEGRLGTVPPESLPPGPQGPQGIQGPAGEGLIGGSLLFLIPGSTVPQGYALKGSTFFNLTLQNKKTTKLTVNVYQKD